MLKNCLQFDIVILLIPDLTYIPDEIKPDKIEPGEMKPNENKSEEIKPEQHKPEHQIKNDTHNTENNPTKKEDKTENLGNNKGSAKDKNITHRSRSSTSEKSPRNNLQAEKMMEKPVKPTDTEKESQNQIEPRLRKMKEADTKNEVNLAENDPKTAEKVLKKLPDPYQDKKDKKIEKIEQKFKKLSQKIENAEKQLLQELSNTLDTQTKEKTVIEDKTNQNLDYIIKSNDDLILDQIHEEAYNHYVDELMKAHKVIEKKIDEKIDQSIDENQKIIDKMDEKIKKFGSVTILVVI